MTARLRQAYGLSLAVGFHLAGLPRVPEEIPSAGGELAIRLAGREPIALSGAPVSPPYGRRDRDGVPVESALGPGGDHLLAYGEHARFHLACDGTVLRCAPRGESRAWERGLLGPVLAQVSALEGNVVFDGSATASKDGAIAFLGDCARVPALAREMIRGGHTILSDGAVALRCAGGKVDVHVGAGAIVALDPVPLRAIVVVKRVPGTASMLFTLPESVPPLMEAWIVPHGPLDRAERRALGFEEVACATPVYCLYAGEDTHPARLAETITSRREPPRRRRKSSSRSPKSA